LLQVEETECDVDFIRGLLPTLSLPALRTALENLGLDASVVPTEVTQAMKADEEFLRALHKMLFDVHVVDGERLGMAFGLGNHRTAW
jgi:hypothetical protein